MGAAEQIAPGIYLVGGPEISHAEDATAFLIDFDGELVMVDCGAGRSVERILDNIEDEGLDPAMISTLILTHAHIDHIGAAPELRRAARLPDPDPRSGRRRRRGGRPRQDGGRLVRDRISPDPRRPPSEGRRGASPFRRGDPPLRPHPGPYARLHRRLAGSRGQAGPLRPGHPRALPAGLRLRYRPVARLDGKAPCLKGGYPLRGTLRDIPAR